MLKSACVRSGFHIFSTVDLASTRSCCMSVKVMECLPFGISILRPRTFADGWRYILREHALENPDQVQFSIYGHRGVITEGAYSMG